MKSQNQYPALALVAALSLTSISAGTIGDGGMSQDLEVGESPPTYGSCNAPISTMSSVHIGKEGADFTITNWSRDTTSGFVIFDAVVDGRQRQFWVTVNLRSGSSASYVVTYATSLELSAIRHCKERPWTIVESGDPVLSVTETVPTE